MTTTVTLAFEGPDSCQNCQRNGIPMCDHIGFNAEAWDYLIGHAVHVPGLDNSYQHWLQEVSISPDRKTITLVTETQRPQFHDLGRHLSTYVDVRAKAAVQAVHHETGETLEEGFYDRFLHEGQQVCVGCNLYHVHKVEHPHRNDNGIALNDIDLQVAYLAPIPTEHISPAR
ncbi:MAG: hypothetical protein ACREQ5_02170 [Candidatus Dormibacteria bacterium]